MSQTGSLFVLLSQARTMSEAGLPAPVREERGEIEGEGVMKRTEEQAHTKD